MDIRAQTRLIIRKNDEYMVGRILYSRKLRWSKSPFDAWWTKDKAKAEVYALRTGGIVMLWNPVAGQLRVL